MKGQGVEELAKAFHEDVGEVAERYRALFSVAEELAEALSIAFTKIHSQRPAAVAARQRAHEALARFDSFRGVSGG